MKKDDLELDLGVPCVFDGGQPKREDAAVAIGREWREALVDELDAPPTMLGHIERRLGEAALVPRGPRGVNAPHYSPIHGARFLIGAVSALSDAAYVASRIAQRVHLLGAMRPLGIPTPLRAITNVSRDDYRRLREQGTDYSYELIPAGTFEAALGHVLENIGRPDSAGSWFRRDIAGVALCWERRALFGEIRLKKDDLLSDYRPVVVYEPSDNPPDAYGERSWRPASFVREARISSLMLSRLGRLTLSRVNAEAGIEAQPALPLPRDATEQTSDSSWQSSSSPTRVAA